MTFEGDAFFVAHHSGMSTGTVLTRVDANTGEVAWSTHLVGAGPIGPSKYRNRMQIRRDRREPHVPLSAHAMNSAASTVQSAWPKPSAIIASMRVAIAGRIVSAMPAASASSCTSRASFRAIASSHEGLS